MMLLFSMPPGCQSLTGLINRTMRSMATAYNMNNNPVD